MGSVKLKANPQGLVASFTWTASKYSGSILAPSKNSPLEASAQKEVDSVNSGVSKVNPDPIGVSASWESNQKTCPPVVCASRIAAVPSHASTEFTSIVNEGCSHPKLT